MTSRSDVVSNPFTADLIRRKAAFLSRSAGFTRSEEEDLRQEMALFLMTKQQLFDAGRGSVEAFVTSVVTSWIGMEVRRRKSRKRRGGLRAFSLDSAFPDAHGESDSLSGLIGDEDGRRRTGRSAIPHEEGVDIRDEWNAVEALLTARERALLRDVVNHGLSGTAQKRRIPRRRIAAMLAAIRERVIESRAGRSPFA